MVLGALDVDCNVDLTLNGWHFSASAGFDSDVGVVECVCALVGGGEDEALAKIEKLKTRGDDELNLWGMELTRIPDAVTQLTSLRSLDVCIDTRVDDR